MKGFCNFLSELFLCFLCVKAIIAETTESFLGPTFKSFENIEGSELISFGKVEGKNDYFFYQTDLGLYINGKAYLKETTKISKVIWSNEKYLLCPTNHKSIFSCGTNGECTNLSPLPEDSKWVQVSCFKGHGLDFSTFDSGFYYMYNQNFYPMDMKSNFPSISKRQLLSSLVFLEDIWEKNLYVSFVVGFFKIYTKENEKPYYSLIIEKMKSDKEHPLQNTLWPKIQEEDDTSLDGLENSELSFYRHNFLFILMYNQTHFYLSQRKRKEDDKSFEKDDNKDHFMNYIPIDQTIKGSFEIKKAKFFSEFSRFLYYEITVEKENYVGVVDALNFLLVSSVKVGENEVVGIKDDVLIVLSNKTYYCPFSEQGDECNFCFNDPKPSANDYMLCKEEIHDKPESCKATSQPVNNENFFNVYKKNCINISETKKNKENKYINTEYFFENFCPFGFGSIAINKTNCESCSFYNQAYNSSSYKCQATCDEGFIVDGGKCVSCKEKGMWWNTQGGSKKCIEDCKNGESNSETGSCIFCQYNDNRNKYYNKETNKCVPNCNALNLTIQNDNVCTKCEEGTFYYDNNCLPNCPNYTVIDGNTCSECKNNYVLDDGKCVENCPENKILVNEKEIQFCRKCQSNYFVLNGKCVSSCPEYTIANTTGYCMNCTKNNTFYFEERCITQSECPKYTIIDKGKNICYYCKSSLFYNDSCIEQCSNTTILKEIDANNSKKINVCEDCPENQYIENNKCVEGCREDGNGLWKGSKVCINCKSNNLYQQKINDTFYCVEACQGAAASDSTTKKCSNCKNFLQDNVCVDKCDENYRKEGKICLRCEENKYLKNGECVTDCGEGLVPEDKRRICFNCSTNGELFYDKKCHSVCPDGTGDGGEGKCVNCTGDKYSFEGKCQEENNIPEGVACTKNGQMNYCKACSLNQYVDNRICVNACPEEKIVYKNICKSCGPDEFLFKEENSCVLNCPEEENMQKANKTCVRCKSYYYNHTCYEDGCPKNTIPSGEVKPIKCVAQCEQGKYLYQGECITKDECTDSHGYAEGKFCVGCAENEKLFNNKSCEASCPEYAIIKGEKNEYCQTCEFINNKKRFFYKGDCYEVCPEGTFSGANNVCQTCFEGQYLFYNKEGIPECISVEVCKNKFYMYDQSLKICKACDSSEYLSHFFTSCQEYCDEYSLVEEKSGRRWCRSCSYDNEYMYQSSCYKTCEEASIKNDGIPLIADEDNKICVTSTCSFKCYGGINCNKLLNKCECKEGYSGNYCEVKEEDLSDKSIEIFAVKFDENNNIIFGFNTRFSYEEIDEIAWNVSSMGISVNGYNETVVKLPTEDLEEKYYEIELKVKNKEDGKIYTDKISYYYEPFDESQFLINIEYDKKIYAMETDVKIIVSNTKNKSKIEELFTYQFYFIDIYNDELPLTEDQSIYNHYEGKIPLTTGIIARISDSKGRYCSKKFDINVYINPFYNFDIKSYIKNNSDNHSNQLTSVYNFLVASQEYSEGLGEEEIKAVQSFSQKLFEDIGQNKILISILNILLHQKSSDELTQISWVEKVMRQSIKNASAKEIKINKNEIKGYYRNIDSILSETLKVRRRLRVLDEKDTSNYQEILVNTQRTITDLNAQLSRAVLQGESISITGKNFLSRVSSPSKVKIPFSISKKNSFVSRRLSEDVDDVNSYSPASYPTSSFSDSCEYKNDNLFCIDAKDIQKLRNKIRLKKSLVLRNLGEAEEIPMSIGLVEIESNEAYQAVGYDSISSTTISSAVLSDGENVEEDTDEEDSNSNGDIDEMKYSVSYDIADSSSFSSVEAANCSCVSFSQLKKPKPSVKCQTYFDYEKSKVICKCSGTGEIVPVYDYALTSLAKLVQFPPINKSLFNPFSTTFTLCSLLLISTFSLALLILDYRDDKNYKPPNPIDEFIASKDMHNSNLLSLAWVATSFSYPFLSVVYLYNYNQPRFFRFLVQIFSCLVSIIFSSLPFYKSEFTYKELFINKRDIETVTYDIHNLPAQINDIVASFIYSIVSSIISNLLVVIFELVLGYKKLLLIFWKERKNILNEYVKMNYVYERNREKDEAFQKRFELKCMALLMFGEEFFKREQIKANRDVYIKRMRENLGKKIISQKEKELNRLSKSVSPLVKKPPKRRIIPKLSLNSDVPPIPEVPSNEKNIPNYSISFEIKALTLNRFVTSAESKETQRLRKKYFMKLESHENPKFTWTPKKNRRLIQFSKDILETCFEDSYTFFNIKKNTNEDSQKRKEKCQIVMMISSVFLLCGMFIVVYLYIFIIFGDIYQRYEFYIVKSWLAPSLINITVFRLLIIFIKNFAFMICIKLLYFLRHRNCLLKLFFRFFVPKYLVSIYKVRDIINKYYYDFKNDVKKLKGEEYVLYY